MKYRSDIRVACRALPGTCRTGAARTTPSTASTLLYVSAGITVPPRAVETLIKRMRRIDRPRCAPVGVLVEDAPHAAGVNAKAIQ